MTTTSRAAAITLLGGAMFLSACGAGGGETAPETVTQTVSADQTTDAGDTAASAAASTTASTDESGQEGATDAAGGDDPVFAAIDAVLAAHPGGIVVDIDREDDRATYDVDVVVGGQVIELEVDASGSVREDEHDDDDDDVRETQSATVTASDAIRQALDQHSGGVLDEIELDSDDGQLTWEIDLDSHDRGDLAELSIPAR